MKNNELNVFRISHVLDVSEAFGGLYSYFYVQNHPLKMSKSLNNLF